MGNEHRTDAVQLPDAVPGGQPWLVPGIGLLLLTLVDALLVRPATPAPGLPALLALATPFLVGTWFLLRGLAPARAAATRVIPALLLVVLVGLVAWPAARSLAHPAAALGTAVALLAMGMANAPRPPLRDAAVRVLGAVQLALAAVAFAADDGRSPGDEGFLLAGSAIAAHAALGGWLLVSGLHGQPQRMLRLASALLAGLGLLAMLGWATGSAAIVQAGTPYVPMQFNTALACVLSAAGLGLVGAGWRRRALLPMLPVLVLAAASLAEEYAGLALGVGEWLIAHGIVAEGVLPGRMAPNTATAFLLAALGIALVPRGDERVPSRWAATWACGFMVSVIGAVVLAGYLVDVPVVRAWGSHTPMALLTGAAVLVLGLGLAFAGPGAGTRDGQQRRGVWLPMLVAMAVTLTSLVVWYGINQDQDRRDKAALKRQMDAVVLALEEGQRTRLSALDRMAARMTRATDAETQRRYFRLDAELFVRDFPSMAAMVWADPDGVAIELYTRLENPPDLLGKHLELDEGLAELFRSAGTDEASDAARSAPVDRGELVVKRAARDGQTLGFLVTAIEYERLFPRVLGGVVPQNTLVLRREGRAVFRRGEAEGPPALVREVEFLDAPLRIELWPIAPVPGTGNFANLLLFTGLATGGLLALALRLAALARERADLAERRGQALRLQVEEHERARTALFSVERELATVFGSISDAFYTLDKEWRFVLLNPQAEALVRRPKEALIGRSVWEAFPEAVGSEVEVQYRKAVAERCTVAFEVFYPPLATWFAIRAFPHPNGLAVYFQDIGERKRAELALARAQASSSRAQRLAQLGAWEYDLATGELQWSDEVLRILGLAGQRMARGLPALLERVAFDDRQRVQEAHHRLHAGEGDIDLEYKVLRPDGDTRTVREIGTLVRDDQGHPLFAAGAMQDITDRRRSEDALRELTRRLEQSLVLNRLVMDNSLDVICAIDANGRFTQVSAASATVWGYPPNELLGRSVADLVHPDDRGATHRAMADVLAGRPTLDFRNRHIARDGRIAIMQWSLVWSPRERLVFAVARDATEAARQSQALREAKESLQRAQQVARMGAWELDLASQRLSWSDEVYSIFAVGRDEFAGNFEAFAARVHPDDFPALQAAQQATLAGGPDLDIEHRILLPDGRTGHVHERARLVRDEAGVPRLLAGSVQDITERKRTQEQLERNEQLLRMAGQTARLGGWYVDLAEQRVVWSEEVAAIHERPAGFSPPLEEAISYYAPEYRERVRSVFLDCVEKGQPYDEQSVLLTASGKRVWIRSLGLPVFDAQGKVVRVQGAFQDISERKQAEAVLQQEREFLKVTLDSLSEGIVACDAKGLLTLFNQATCELHGLPDVPLEAKDWAAHYDLYHPDGVTPMQMEDVPLFRALRGDVVREVEMVIAPKNLPRRLVLCSGERIRAPGGELLGAVVAMHDITVRKQQERRLRESEQRMRTTVESAFDCIITMGDDGRIIEFNPAAERLFGHARADVIGRKLSDVIIPPGLRAPHEAGMRRYLETGEERVLGRRLELSALRADGEEIQVELSITEVESETGRAFTGFIRDITAAKLAQRIEAGKRAILAGIAARRPLPESLDAVARLYQLQYPEAMCSILLLDEDGQRVLNGAAPDLPEAFTLGVHGQPIGPKAGSCGTAAWRRERVVVTDIATDPLWEDYRALALEHGLRACWSTPVLSAKGMVLATFATYYRQPRTPTEAELAVVDSLAAMVAMAVEQVADYRRIQLSEQRFRSLFDEHPDAVYAMDLEGRYTDYNGRLRATGRTIDQVRGQMFDANVAPEQREVVRAHFSAAVRGEARTYEATAVLEGGHRLDMRVTNLPIVVDGRVTGVFGIAQDISLLRKHQRDLADALDAAENNSRQLRRLSDAAILLNRDVAERELYQLLADQARTILGANQAVASVILGGQDHQIHAVSLAEKYAAWREYAAPPDNSGIYAMVAETNRPMRLTQAELEAHPRWRGFGPHAKGHPPMRGWLAVPLIDSAGRNMGLLQLSDKLRGEFTEDDELVAMQFAQMASIAIERARLIERLSVRDRFFDMSAEIFVIFDPTTRRWLQVNPVFTEITGYTAQELCSRDFTDFIHPDDHGATRERAARLKARVAVPLHFENRYVRKDGAVRWIDWISVPGADGLVYGVGRDITERRRAEQALRQTLADLNNRNRELQDFAFIASHDLQEPLRKIRAFSDRLQERHAAQLDPEARDYLDRTGQAAARMQTLIDDLLAYSRVVARGKPFAQVDLDKVLSEVIEDLEARLESSGGRVERSGLPTLEGDPTQMRQLLQNLLANALKFRSPDRPPVVKVSATPATLEGAPAWELRIEDNGIGFEPRYAEKIFGPFQRLHGRHEYDGTGIGLAIVRRIAERHRGTVRAEGRPGAGAAFILMLPAHQPAEPRLSPPAGGLG
ncbi:PAS domain S-box protein [Arenimonas sp.]|uniref:PAS domain S-box protein n=1 Tax=Arenimonas sp. TaxID=1872635 RepID=UPI002E30B221|nr:PAS domain S-box protein [Arenimonas sp.]HEX4853643.1 PAS domain S-box protein [Arenimonas sp.]